MAKKLKEPEGASRREVYDEVCALYRWAKRAGYQTVADRLDAIAVATWTNYPAK